jgi:putative redox protein
MTVYSSLLFTLFASFSHHHNNNMSFASVIARSLRPSNNLGANPRVGGVMFQRSKCLLFSSTNSKDVTGSTSSSEEKEQYAKAYRLDGVGRRSKVEIQTKDTGHTLSTDVPKKMGGGDTAPQPVETLLAAWMGCTQATALFVGRQMSPRILIESLEFVGIEAVRDERGALSLPIEETPTIPSRLHRVTGVINVRTRSKVPLPTDQLDLLKEQTEIRCPVANMMIASGCSMDVDWVDATAIE